MSEHEPGWASVDLDADSRGSLEFDELLAWVASLARTEPGRRRVAARSPSADPRAAARELAAVEEVRRHLRRDGRVVAEPIGDPSAALAALEIEGLALEARPLRDLAGAIRSASALGRRLRALGAADQAWLRSAGERIPDLERECRPIVDGIEPEGRLRDEASPALGRIRGETARTGERLRALLERIVRDPDSGAVIRDGFITQRNGRFVVPVRTDAPRSLRGIVHASSSSGATRFVEPLETVEMNNDLVRSAEREREEEARLLAEWTGRLRLRRADIATALGALAEIDDAQARALFAEECSAIAPELSRDGPLALVAARHPLLDRRLRAAGGGAVPLDLALDPAAGVLVLSGPNAGGKTVALKTLGLCALMAQAGIPVPAREARLPCYAQVRVDIGDHQSIQADLSTFSAHVRAIAGFLAGLRPPALLLFDEIGSGTEPGEGAALARAVLEWLVGRDVTAVATTHLGEVKEWAVASGLAASAAMEFDAAHLRPTFRIVMGATGVSAGLEIARRAGLAEAIVERAREHLGPDARRRERYLARLAELIAAREQAAAGIEDERRSLELARAELARRSAAERGAWLEQATRRLERTVAELVERGRKELSAIRDAPGREKRERRFSQLEREMRAAPARLAGEARAAETAGGELPEEVGPGTRVLVLSLGRSGEVVETRGSRVRVRLGELAIDAERSDLRLAATAESAAPPRRVAPAAPRPTPVDVAGAGRELMLIGMRAADAIPALDRFLDAAILAGHDEVRIVHGHGTGRLREAVRAHLREHAAVATQRAGGPGEGGDGATIARLAD